MSNEIKEKEEYEKYARDHRKELDAQEVKIGDVVKVLVGQFAGETGIVIGIIACDKSDYTDPYYEIALNCEVPEKYKCRKTLMTPNNVIGGLSAHEFEVIGNRAPKQPSMEIKQGDRVRVSKDIPQFYLEYNSYRMFEIEHRVVDVNIEDGFALLDSIPPKFTTILPAKYLVKVDAEAKEAKFKVGDKVVVHYPSGDRIGRIKEVMLDGTYDIDFGGGCTGHNITRSQIEQYVAPKIKIGDRVRCKNPLRLANYTDNVFIGIVTDAVTDGENGWFSVRMDNGAVFQTYHESDLELIEPAEQTEAEKPNHTITIPVEVDLTDSYWDAYAADFAKEIVLKTVNSASDRRPSVIAEYATDVAKAVVEGLKRK